MKHLTFLTLSLIFLFAFIFGNNISAQNRNDRTITIHVRGVAETKITITPFEGARAINPIAIAEKVKTGQSAKLVIPEKYLPGEFVLRADYVAKPGDQPYPSEKTLIIYKEDFEIYTHPMYINNRDSTWYSHGEQENTVNYFFREENTKKRAQLDILKHFLTNYDNPHAAVYKKGVKEYEKRRKSYNKWLNDQTLLYSDLFASSLFQFQFMPPVKWGGDEAERTNQLLKHYFAGINFNDSLIIRTPEADRFMNNYMGIYGMMATSVELRDSLFTQAGRIACEKASQGHPYVYGWMVDYFRNGYSTYDIKQGLEMLQKHIDNPNCLTANKREIVRRLEEMTKLVPGITAPDFTLKDSTGKDFNLYSWKGNAKHKLLVLWSADCDHCVHTVAELKGWYNQTANYKLADIIAVSLDETETEIPKWEAAKRELPGWIHLRAVGGINSDLARDYAILATPVILLLDSQTNIIKATPRDTKELEEALKK